MSKKNSLSLKHSTKDFQSQFAMLFKNETTIRPPAHTHNANTGSEEISPYDSQGCLIRIKKKHLILLLVHSVGKIHFESRI